MRNNTENQLLGKDNRHLNSRGHNFRLLSIGVISFILMNQRNCICQQNSSFDTTLAKSQSELLVFLDFYHQRVPAIDEVKCFMEGLPREPFYISILKSTNFEGYCFLQILLDTVSNSKLQEFQHPSKPCTYQVLYGQSRFILGYDLVHNKIYRLQGFYSSDFKEMYSDYFYFNNQGPGFYNKYEGRKKFIKNHYVENLSLLKVWKKTM